MNGEDKNFSRLIIMIITGAGVISSIIILSFIHLSEREEKPLVVTTETNNSSKKKLTLYKKRGGKLFLATSKNLTTTTQETPYLNVDLSNMVLIPEGYFIMGRNNGDKDEAPPHKIYLDGFYIDKTEVTNYEYKECVKSNICSPTEWLDDKELGNDKLPVVGVNWFDATTFCNWKGKELPTEAQWEKAARGEDERIYPWGNEPPTCYKAIFLGCNRLLPAIIGERIQGGSPYGVLDMAGNVWEWVKDWYAPDYYSNSPELNPEGPTNGMDKVLRGGSWRFGPKYITTTNRHHDSPYNRVITYGFRCVYIPPKSPTRLQTSTTKKEYSKVTPNGEEDTEENNNHSFNNDVTE